jgi:hypothetical protein
VIEAFSFTIGFATILIFTYSAVITHYAFAFD